MIRTIVLHSSPENWLSCLWIPRAPSPPCPLSSACVIWRERRRLWPKHKWLFTLRSWAELAPWATMDPQWFLRQIKYSGLLLTFIKSHSLRGGERERESSFVVQDGIPGPFFSLPLFLWLLISLLVCLNVPPCTCELYECSGLIYLVHYFIPSRKTSTWHIVGIQ